MTAAVTAAARAVDAATVMGMLPVRPRLLALGEPTHGEDDLLELRNDLFRQLVEQEGYRAVAIESDCLMGLVVDDYVSAGTGDLDDVMERGFSHGFGASAANRSLVRWMRAYNDGRPAAQHVRFAGFDGPVEMTGTASPRQALVALHGYLAAQLDAVLLPCTAGALDELLGVDDRWADPGTLMDPARSVGREPFATELRLLADDLVAVLDGHAPQLIAETSREEWQRAKLYARTAAGLLRYHYWLADTSPSRMPRLLDLRASMMAANLLALADRGPTLAFAHNGHLQRDKSSMRLGGMHLEWWSAGAIVDAHLGAGYAFFGTALGTIRHQGVDAPPADTVEGQLYALPEERLLVDARGLAAALASAPPVTRVSSWFGYAPLDPAHLGRIDGIAFVKDVG